jgi:uncharacterized protein (DUF983 family)
LVDWQFQSFSLHSWAGLKALFTCPNGSHGSYRDIFRPVVVRLHANTASVNWGHKMNFGFIASLVIAILGIVGVFIAIPIISDYAFWVVVVAYIVLAGTR